MRDIESRLMRHEIGQPTRKPPVALAEWVNQQKFRMDDGKRVRRKGIAVA